MRRSAGAFGVAVRPWLASALIWIGCVYAFAANTGLCKGYGDSNSGGASFHCTNGCDGGKACIISTHTIAVPLPFPPYVMICKSSYCECEDGNSPLGNCCHVEQIDPNAPFFGGGFVAIGNCQSQQPTCLPGTTCRLYTLPVVGSDPPTTRYLDECGF